MDNYFVYEHWRKDLNVCFYVGLGKTPPPEKVWKHNTRYSRAYSRTKRSEPWKRVAEVADIEVKIVFESSDRNVAVKMESSLIVEYGRVGLDNGGTLVNLVIGSGFGRGRSYNKPIIKINQIDIASGELIRTWDSPMDIEVENGFFRTNIVKCCRNRQVSAYGFKWRYANFDYKDSVVNTSRVYKTESLQVPCYRDYQKPREKVIKYR